MQTLQGSVTSVVNVTSLVPDGLYQYGDRIGIGVRFTGAVSVSTSGGAPYLALDFAGERRVAQYAAGNGTDTLEFRYDVRYGDRHAGLNYTGASALSDGGGSIKGASGLHADLELPPPGGRGSLSANSNIVLGIAPPIQVPHLGSFGASGRGIGEFRHPLGVAVSPVDGRIAVADTDNSRVQVFHPNGTFAFRLGELDGIGHGDAEFYYPYGVAFALDGRIAVADTHNHRIQVFHPDGAFDFRFTTHDRERVISPYDIAVDPGGRFVVPGHVFRPDGTYSHATYGGGAGVAASASARIASADGYRLHVEHANGTVISETYRSGVYDGQLEGASDVAFDNAGRLVVADTGNNRIQVFHPDGAFALRFGERDGGDGDGEFDGPGSVAVSPLDGRIVVADTGNHRIQVFAPPGANGSGGTGQQPPAATAVTSPSPQGVYGEGDRILLNVHFTAPVVLSGPQPPSLALDTGAPAPRSAEYAGGNGTAMLRFSYTVQPDDRTDDLEYAGADALAAPNRHSITGAAGPSVDSLSLPIPGTAGSLAYSSNIRLDGGRPAAVNMTVAIEPGTAAAGPINATDGGDGVRLELDVTRLAAAGGSGGSGAVAFPPDEVVVITSFAEITFPPGVAATSVPDSGLLALYVSPNVPDNGTVQDALAYAGSGRVALQTVVEVGGSDARVRFDMPVRISLEGQAGGRAFYIDGAGAGGAIVPIDRLCAADDTARVDRQLGGSGECQLDADGDKVIHTYHLTRFGTAAAAEDGAPPPSYHTCSARLGETEMDASAAPGGRSAAARQDLVNSGSLPFVGVGLEATPWHPEGGGSAAQGAGSGAPLPASATGVSEEGAGVGYAAISNGTAVARGLGGGDVAPLWFRADLASHGGAPGDILVQHVAYLAECSPP